MNRRNFFGGAAMTAVAAASVSRVALAALPEPVLNHKPDTAAPLHPGSGRPYNPVVTLNGWTLPWRMNQGVKEFHLVAEPVVREIAPGMKAHLWGYNGQSPGPTIEVVEGDRVRVFVTNRLPEHTTIHWHGQRLPSGMDGVGGLTQPAIPVGKTFVYEFEARRPGTFMYHPHADEMTQMAMGMMGFWITHPKAKHPLISEVQRDAQDQHHDRLQPLDLEQPCLPRHRLAQRAAERQGTHPGRQPDHDQPPDPPARSRIHGHRQ
jgi:FtsP/CotA-like multicopper oxidase with cupredoxin domain